jgi:hypothetical protein
MTEDDPRRPPLLGDLGDALLWIGRFDEAEHALADAIELASRPGDELTRVRAELAQMRLRFQIDPEADYEEIEAKALEAAALCAARGDDFGAARAWRIVYWARWGSASSSECGRPRSRRTSTTGVRRTPTIRRTT